MKMAQSGQYNYKRCIKRKEFVAAHIAESEFIEATISMIFLLNKKYRPFYKWMHKAMHKLPVLGSVIYQLLSELADMCENGDKDEFYCKNSRIIEEVCTYVIREMARQKMSDSSSDFLLDHGPLVQDKIQDNTLRNINVWLD